MSLLPTADGHILAKTAGDFSFSDAMTDDIVLFDGTGRKVKTVIALSELSEKQPSDHVGRYGYDEVRQRRLLAGRDS